MNTIKQKSHIWETKNLLTNADSRTNTILERLHDLLEEEKKTNKRKEKKIAGLPQKKILEKPLENLGKTLGKPRENPGKTLIKPRENPREAP